MQLQNTFDKAKLDSDLKKKEEEQKSTKEIIFGALRKISGGSRKNSKVSNYKIASEICHINLFLSRNRKSKLRSQNPLHRGHHQRHSSSQIVPRFGKLSCSGGEKCREILTCHVAPSPAPPVLPSPKQERTRTPVPSDSPLLSKVRPDPILKRIRSFNKSLKKASSFRAAREKTSELVCPIEM